ncbi:MAG TPA: GNAT family N-acetyltransferase [Pyrinomonadaceae bacterium]|nr:GNAT family N-acetyltransferase [Pyrinomonadaceae bacterium]
MTTDTAVERARIRPARAGEAGLLSDLALRSKAHWGYDADFLEACREELTVSADYIRGAPVFVLEEDGRVVGFYGLREQGDGLELLYLFVEPAAIGGGHGKKLWAHAVETAARLGFQKISIESDPYAEAFYLAMGARRVGEVSSTLRPGRKLPLLGFSLAPEGAA